MKRETLLKIVDQVERLIDTGATTMWPAPAPQAASNYADPAVMERERALIKTMPIIVGHASKLREPGDYFLHDETGVPILVVRQNDGSLRAVVNICSHRGARLCTKPEGRRASFSCPYHAWNFRLDGSLRTVPVEDGFKGLDRAQLNLQQLPVEERHGFVWVVATPGASIDVASFLGAALDEELASYGASDMQLQMEERMAGDLNWKFVLDGFLEVYHFATLHSKSIAPYFMGSHSPFDEFGQHGRLVGVRASFEKVRGVQRDDIASPDLIKHLAVNYYLFPNTILVWQGDHFECWTAFPGARPGASVTHVQAVVSPALATPEYEARWDRNWKIMVSTVVDEDWAMSKTIQQSVHAMPNNRIVFGRNEPGLQHFHGELARQLGHLS